MIFVTGGTGLVGAHLLFELIQKDESLKASKRPGSNLDLVKKIFSYYSKDAESLFEKIQWIDVDLHNEIEIAEQIHDCDYVYHCAASVSFNPKEKAAIINNNVDLTANLVNACLSANIKKLCHVSSVAAIGNAPEDEITTELTKWKPKSNNSAYSISKYKSELEIWRGIHEGLNAVIVNPSIILGPGNWKIGSPSIVSRIDKGMKYYTEGVTGYVGVWDVVKCMMLLMESEISNDQFVLNSANLSFKELFSEIASNLSKKAPSKLANDRLLSLAVKGEKIRSFISRTSPQLTKDSIKSATSKTFYSAEKLSSQINFTFEKIEDTLKKVCNLYLEDAKYKS